MPQVSQNRLNVGQGLGQVSNSGQNKQNIGSFGQKQSVRLSSKITNTSIPLIFEDYRDTNSYVSFLSSLPGARSAVLNRTYNGNAITAVSFGTGPLNVVFIGGVHAREWISPISATYLAWYLMTSSSPEVVSLRRLITFTMIPVVNPDGYEYTRTVDRLWRKNREPNINPKCVGTDINRNFETKFGLEPQSGDECSDTYRGKRPYSSIEANAVRQLLIKGALSFVDLHAYRQAIMFPTLNNCNSVKDIQDITAATTLAVNEMNGLYDKVYTNKAFCGADDMIGGSSDDTSYTAFKVKYAMTIELRDTGTYGFNLPKEQIVPQGDELVRGMIALWTYAANNPNRR